MARKRMVDPSIWDDEDIGMLSLGAFKLFVGCFSNADDEGKLEASPVRLRGMIFKYHSNSNVMVTDSYSNNNVTVEDVSVWLDEIDSAVRSFIRYEVEGKSYMKFLKWKEYQTIQKPQKSRIPDPLQYQYDTDTLPLQPKRNEVKGIEKKRGEAKGAHEQPDHGESDTQSRETPGRPTKFSLCALYERMTGRQSNTADKRLNELWSQRPDWNEHIALSALQLCHENAIQREDNEHWFPDKGLVYYENAILKALKTRIMPGQTSINHSKGESGNQLSEDAKHQKDWYDNTDDAHRKDFDLAVESGKITRLF